jgi:N-acetyl-anhydromuramyl-L-alanine amidase AmpD
LKNLCPWTENEELLSAFNQTVEGWVLDQPQAMTVMKLLLKESEHLIRHYVGDSFYEAYFPTERHGGPWSHGNPTGVVDHYTAAAFAPGTLKWFSSQPRKDQSNSSAHVVIDRNGAIMIVVDPMTTIAWHATKANPTHIGIEHVNCGLLRKSMGQIFYMENVPYPAVRTPDVYMDNVTGNHWEPFTSAQIVSNIVLKRWLTWAIPELTRPNFVEHKDVDPTRKVDCGPLWPAAVINDLVFSDRDFDGMAWLSKDVLREKDVADLKMEIQGRLGSVAGGA